MDIQNISGIIEGLGKRCEYGSDCLKGISGKELLS
jgi:hypothetical protein